MDLTDPLIRIAVVLLLIPFMAISLLVIIDEGARKAIGRIILFFDIPLPTKHTQEERSGDDILNKKLTSHRLPFPNGEGNARLPKGFVTDVRLVG